MLPSPNGKLLAVQTQTTHAVTGAIGAGNSRVFVVQLATGRVLQTHTAADRKNRHAG